MEYIYILSAKYGQRDPEVISVCTTYEDMIVSYYENHKYDWMFVCRYPVNVIIKDNRLQRSSKYAFKIPENLKEEYIKCKRELQLTKALSQTSILDQPES